MPLDKKLLITLSLVALIGGLFILATTQLTPSEQTPTTTIPSWDAQTTGSQEEGDAQIQLAPRYENNQLVVRYRADTHTLDLEEYDLKELTTLYVEGNQLQPQQATPMGGHHPSGEITFNTEKPETFSIAIQEIGLEETREYKWS